MKLIEEAEAMQKQRMKAEEAVRKEEVEKQRLLMKI